MTIPAFDWCPACPPDGSYCADCGEGWISCPECDGTGRRERLIYTQTPRARSVGPEYEEVECPDCKGTGVQG